MKMTLEYTEKKGIEMLGLSDARGLVIREFHRCTITVLGLGRHCRGTEGSFTRHPKALELSHSRHSVDFQNGRNIRFQYARSF